MSTESNEAKKYCIEVAGMSENDFTLATWDDVGIDGIEKGDWVTYFTIPTECGDESDMKSAIEIEKDHRFWSNPENVKAYEDHLFETYVE